jgi:glutamate/tyrosine decarboxylase-like PLP-dependent enzyme
LKIWLTLRYYGVRRISAAITDDIGLATYLGELIGQSEEFELLAPVELSICCFRYVPPELRTRLRGANEAEAIEINGQLDKLNTRIMNAVQTGGRAYLSNASVRGRFGLRACITNFRTTRADIEETIKVVREVAFGVR